MSVKVQTRYPNEKKNQNKINSCLKISRAPNMRSFGQSYLVSLSQNMVAVNLAIALPE